MSRRKLSVRDVQERPEVDVSGRDGVERLVVQLVVVMRGEVPRTFERLMKPNDEAKIIIEL